MTAKILRTKPMIDDYVWDESLSSNWISASEYQEMMKALEEDMNDWDDALADGSNNELSEEIDLLSLKTTQDGNTTQNNG